VRVIATLAPTKFLRFSFLSALAIYAGMRVTLLSNAVERA
jgi:hypothetical protein